MGERLSAGLPSKGLRTLSDLNRSFELKVLPVWECFGGPAKPKELQLETSESLYRFRSIRAAVERRPTLTQPAA